MELLCLQNVQGANNGLSYDGRTGLSLRKLSPLFSFTHFDANGATVAFTAFNGVTIAPRSVPYQNAKNFL
jgi:hypothetical protein